MRAGPKLFVVCGELHSSGTPWSTWQTNVEFGSSDSNANVGVVSWVSP